VSAETAPNQQLRVVSVRNRNVLVARVTNRRVELDTPPVALGAGSSGAADGSARAGASTATSRSCRPRAVRFTTARNEHESCGEHASFIQVADKT
jgi:hypothetical protein